MRNDLKSRRPPVDVGDAEDRSPGRASDDPDRRPSQHLFHQSQVGSGAAGPCGPSVAGRSAAEPEPDRIGARRVDRLTDPAGQALPGVHRSRWRTRPPAGRSAPQPARIPSRNCRHANLCRLRGVVGRAAGVGREMPPGAVENRDRRWQDRGGAPGSIEERARALLARCAGVLEELGGRGGSMFGLLAVNAGKCAHKDKLVRGPEAPRCRRKRSRGDRFRSSLVNRPARHSYRLPIAPLTRRDSRNAAELACSTERRRLRWTPMHRRIQQRGLPGLRD